MLLSKACRYCRCAIDERQFVQLGGACDSPECQAKWRSELVRQKRRDDEARRMEAGERAAAAIDVQPLPANIRTLTELPGWRKAALETHLRSIIDAAWAAEPVVAATPERVEPEQTTVPSPLAATGCGVCGGRCCVAGAEHGMLTIETIQRYRATRPAATPDDVLDAYRTYLGGETYEGSCVYHAANGCKLPRDLRASLCNSFECDELVQLQIRHELPTGDGSATKKPLVLVALDGAVGVRAQVVSLASRE